MKPSAELKRIKSHVKVDFWVLVVAAVVFGQFLTGRECGKYVGWGWGGGGGGCFAVRRPAVLLAEACLFAWSPLG